MVLSRPEGLQACSQRATSPALARPFRPYLQTRQHRLCHARQAAQTAVSKQGRAPARSERPEIPINTNSSENDIRAFVTKRKISGGTISDKGRDARDIMLGLAKPCMKLKLSFYEFIGARLGIPGPKIPPLASLIRPAPA